MNTKPRAGKKSLRETFAENAAAEKLWAAMHGKPLRDMSPAPAKRTRSAAVNKPTETEADALKAITQYMNTRSDIVMLWRQNSGMAQSSNGAPIYFYRWVKGRDMRIPDLVGMDANGMMFAIEVKRPGWRKPSDQREIEQQNFLTMIQEHGGRAGFATCIEDAAKIMGMDMGDGE